MVPGVDLTPFDPQSSVSRRHALIRLGDGVPSLEDLQSRNATRLAGATLTAGAPEALRDGDLISFGSVTVAFRLLESSELPVPWSTS